MERKLTLKEYQAARVRKVRDGEPVQDDIELVYGILASAAEEMKKEEIVYAVQEKTNLDDAGARDLTTDALRKLKEAGRVNHVRHGYWRA